MSLKVEFPRPPQVSRPKVQSPVTSGFAPGAPAPSSMSAKVADGFERRSTGTSPVGVGGSQLARTSGVSLLPPRLEPWQPMVENMAQVFIQQHGDKLDQLDLDQAEETFANAYLAAGASLGDAKLLSKETSLRVQALRGQSTAGGSQPADGFVSHESMAQIERDVADETVNAKTLGDFIEAYKKLEGGLKPREGETLDALKAALALELGKAMVEKGIEPGQLPGRVRTGQDGFHPGNGGFVPGDRLEELPAKLEPHRDALEKLTGDLLRDSKLDNGARLRKALWGELKKLPFPDEATRRLARERLLEEIHLRQDRYTK